MPTARLDTLRTIRNRAKAVLVLANDEGSGLTVTGHTDPAHGAVSYDAETGFLYTPDTGYAGLDSFDYTATDDASATSTATVSISVLAPNHPPVAGGAPLAVAVGGSLSIDPLALASDPDDDALSLSGTTKPAHGMLTVELNGTLTYRPYAGYEGLDRVAYDILDERGYRVEGSHVVTVGAADEPPVAVPDVLATLNTTPVSFNPIANDTDPDLDTLRLAGVQLPASGKIKVNKDRTLTYTPAAAFVGDDAFSYVVTDGRQEDSAGVLVSVTAPAPVVLRHTNGFLWRRTIVIPKESVRGAASIPNYLFYFDETHEHFKSVVNGGQIEHAFGYDVRLEVNGAAAPWRRKLHDRDTGRLVAFARIDLSVAVDTVVDLYYGKPDLSSDEADPAGCYSPVCLAVWDALTGQDMTGAGRNLGTPSGVTQGELLGPCGVYDGAASIAGPTTSAAFADGHTAFTVEAWVDVPATGHHPAIISAGPSGATLEKDLGLVLGSNNPGQDGAAADTWAFKLHTTGGAERVEAPAGAQTVGKHFLAGVWTSAVGSKLFVDTKFVEPSNSHTIRPGTTTVSRSTGQFNLGWNPANGVSWWPGSIDEVRIRSTEVTEGLLQTQAANYTAPRDFYGIGSPDRVDDDQRSPVAVPMAATALSAIATLIDVAARSVLLGTGTKLLGAVSAPLHGTTALSSGKAQYKSTAGFVGDDRFDATVRGPAGVKTSTAPVFLRVSASPAAPGRLYNPPHRPTAESEIAVWPLGGSKPTGWPGNWTQYLLIDGGASATGLRIAENGLKYKGIFYRGARHLVTGDTDAVTPAGVTVRGSGKNVISLLFATDMPASLIGGSSGDPLDGRPFIWLDGLDLDSCHASGDVFGTQMSSWWGDVYRFGCPTSDPRKWPDVYMLRCRTISGYFFGASDYHTDKMQNDGGQIRSFNSWKTYDELFGQGIFAGAGSYQQSPEGWWEISDFVAKRPVKSTKVYTSGDTPSWLPLQGSDDSVNTKTVANTAIDYKGDPHTFPAATYAAILLGPRVHMGFSAAVDTTVQEKGIGLAAAGTYVGKKLDLNYGTRVGTVGVNNAASAAGMHPYQYLGFVGAGGPFGRAAGFYQNTISMDLPAAPILLPAEYGVGQRVDTPAKLLAYLAGTTSGGTPTAANDTVTVTKNTATDIDVMANDGPAGQIELDAVVTAPAHGTLRAFSADRTKARYTPATDYVGADSFAYRIRATGDTSKTAQASVAVTVANTSTKWWKPGTSRNGTTHWHGPSYWSAASSTDANFVKYEAQIALISAANGGMPETSVATMNTALGGVSTGSPGSPNNTIATGSQLDWKSGKGHWGRVWTKLPGGIWTVWAMDTIGNDRRTDKWNSGTKANPVWHGPDPSVWQDMINGDFDQLIINFGARILANYTTTANNPKNHLPERLIVRMNHEMNQSNKYQVFADTRAKYKSATERFIDKARIGLGEIATKVKFLHAPAHGPSIGAYSDWCPSNVDALAVSWHPGKPVKNAADVADYTNGDDGAYGLKQMKAHSVTTGLPMCIPEWSPRYEWGTEAGQQYACPVADLTMTNMADWLDANSDMMVCDCVYHQSILEANAYQNTDAAGIAAWRRVPGIMKTRWSGTKS